MEKEKFIRKEGEIGQLGNLTNNRKQQTFIVPNERQQSEEENPNPNRHKKIQDLAKHEANYFAKRKQANSKATARCIANNQSILPHRSTFLKVKLLNC